MKLKKIVINILDTKDIIHNIDEMIVEEDFKNDLYGFHIVLTNKTVKKHATEFLVESSNDVFWSLDMKKNVKKMICMEYNLHKCVVNIGQDEKMDIIIWVEVKEKFVLKNIKNSVANDFDDKLDNLLLDTTTDKNFEEIFGFRKKYHFDQYRFMLVLNMCNNVNVENEALVKEMVDKIIKHAKIERRIEDGSLEFYEKVFMNLLEENAGALDAFGNYRSKILSKLRIKVNNIDIAGDTKINVNRQMFGGNGINMVKRIELGKIEDKKDDKKSFVMNERIENNPFERNKVMRSINHRVVDGDVFLLGEFYRKGQYLNPNESIILYKYKNSNFASIEKTIEKIVLGCSGETYEILLYLDHVSYLSKFEKILENMFFNYDRLQKVKVVVPSKNIRELGEMQKLVILTHFVNSISEYMFLVSINSWFPPRYMSFIRQKYKEDDNCIVGLRSCNMINMETGRIDVYEANRDKLFSYFVECIFPVMPKTIFKRINFKAPFLAGFEKFKDFKNFLVKNGTILDLKLLDGFGKDGLHVFEGGK